MERNEDRAYRKNNKQKININKNIYEQEKLKNDPVFRLRKRLSKSINNALKLNNSSKNGKSILNFYLILYKN